MNYNLSNSVLHTFSNRAIQKDNHIFLIMTSRYRVEYALKSHRRDEFIEWIKGLLATPFVLHADDSHADAQIVAENCQARYYEIFKDVESLVKQTIFLDELNELDPKKKSISRLRTLVPSLGKFFTELPLADAFLLEDERRAISKRRLVSPSFNDVRMILNTAQIMALTNIYKQTENNTNGISGKNQQQQQQKLKLITFDGDVTLYEDGKSLDENSEVVQRLVKLLSLGLYVGVVTAAGYPRQSGAEKYYERLKGLIDHLNSNHCTLKTYQKDNLLVMGAESNYLFRYNNEMKGLKFIDDEEWFLPQVKNWNIGKINYIMDTLYKHLIYLRNNFNLEDSTTIIKKERSVGIIPNSGCRILREQLEEMVLSCSRKLNTILTSSSNFADSTEALCVDDIKVCAFNGGSDVWVDIGDKALGVESLQKYICHDETVDHVCPIGKSESLHIGDQFASLGANDFKARLSACTVWIASPRETVAILDDLIDFIEG